MSKKLRESLGEGWNAEQNALFSQMTAKNNPPEQEYQNNIRQKLKEVQDKANNSVQQQATPPTPTPPQDTSAVQAQTQAQETVKKLAEINTEVDNKSKQLQQNQAEIDQIAQKIEQEKKVVEQVHAILDQPSRSSTAEVTPTSTTLRPVTETEQLNVENEQNLAGAIDNIENSN